MALMNFASFCLVNWYQVIEAQVEMPVVGAISLYVSLLTFALRVHSDRLDYVDQVLVSLFSSRNSNKIFLVNLCAK